MPKTHMTTLRGYATLDGHIRSAGNGWLAALRQIDSALEARRSVEKQEALRRLRTRIDAALHESQDIRHQLWKDMA